MGIEGKFLSLSDEQQREIGRQLGLYFDGDGQYFGLELLGLYAERASYKSDPFAVGNLRQAIQDTYEESKRQ